MTEASFRAQLVTRRTYNRIVEGTEDVYETWEQTVDRVIGHQEWLWKKAQGRPLNKHQTAELAELRQLCLDRKGLPAGRTLWLGGTEIARERSSSMFNCAATRVQSVHDLVDVLWLLLQGCGVGFVPVAGSLNGFVKPIADIQVIRSTRTEKGGRETNLETWDDETKTWTISVGDCAKAWAKSVGKLVAGKYPADKLVLDFSQIRPAGKRLRGYGWISQGDETIAIAYRAIATILNQRAGQLLRKMDIHDICNWLGTVLSTRRSAQISLMEYGSAEWREFATCKKNMYELGRHQREQSNNSLIFNERPSKDQLAELFGMMLDGGGSEPGFINGEEARRRAPWFVAVNPCLTGDTLVSTAKGLRRIGQLASERHIIRDGSGSLQEALFKKTADKAKLVQIELSDGSLYRCTPNHNWCIDNPDAHELRATKDLVTGDVIRPSNIEGMFGKISEEKNAYLDAWMIADGTWYNNKNSSKLALYWPKYKCQTDLEAAGCVFGKEQKQRCKIANFAGRPLPDKTKVPDYVLAGNRETVTAFLKGYLESDGHIGHTVKGWTVQVTSVHRNFLQDFQALLKLFGVCSKITIGHKATVKKLPDGKGDYKDYPCQDSWRLTVTNPAKLFETISPERNKRAPYNVNQHPLVVISITNLDEEEAVYCCGVPTTNSFDLATAHTGNCGEILLPDKGFCNLVSVDWGKFKEDNAGLHRAVFLLARANYRQTLVNLDDGILQRAWHENNEFLHLCGVSPMGQVRRPDIDAYDKRVLKNTAIAGAYSMADELGTPRPKNVTTGKPDGTLAKVADSTEGIHKPLARYIFNHIAFSSHDPLVQQLRDHGYTVFDHPSRPGDVVVAIPVAWEDVPFELWNGMHVNLESAIDQLDRYKEMMLNYTEQNQSITISYDPSEVPAMIDWIFDNWNSYVGVSFLLRADPTKTAADLGYPYLPQQPVTKEQYDAYCAQITPFNVEGGDLLGEDDCAGGACPIR